MQVVNKIAVLEFPYALSGYCLDRLTEETKSTVSKNTDVFAGKQHTFTQNTFKHAHKTFLHPTNNNDTSNKSYCKVTYTIVI